MQIDEDSEGDFGGLDMDLSFGSLKFMLKSLLRVADMHQKLMPIIALLILWHQAAADRSNSAILKAVAEEYTGLHCYRTLAVSWRSLPPG